MPTTWYVARGGGAIATDASEPGGASVVSRLGELCEAVSAGGELVVFASSAGVSVVLRLCEVCEAVSARAELVVFASSVGVSVAARLGEVCEAVSASVAVAELWVGRGGGAPHEGQAVANELISLPQS